MNRLPELKPTLVHLFVTLETTEADPEKVRARVERELRLQFRDGVSGVMLIKA